ncbi:MAG: hypothetical protein LBH45_00535 [Campylobacteraceae bacterium]|jgi:hypothetical protein|nr:hypothetical protein [Campylobacteraceae bacterium]
MRKLASILVLTFVVVGFTACESEADKLAKTQTEGFVNSDIEKWKLNVEGAKDQLRRWQEKEVSPDYPKERIDAAIKNYTQVVEKRQACVSEMEKKRIAASQSKACQEARKYQDI